MAPPERPRLGGQLGGQDGPTAAQTAARPRPAGPALLGDPGAKTRCPDGRPHDWALRGPPAGGIACRRCGARVAAKRTVTPQELAYLAERTGPTP